MIAVHEILEARELIANLVRRELKVRYRGTFLGLLWSLATPLLMVLLYTFVFTFIFRLAPTPETTYPFAIYLFSGLVLWNFFSGSLSSASNSVVSSSYLLGKVYFPRMILPLTSVLTGAVTLCFEATVLFVAALAVGVWPTPWSLLTPVIVLLTGFLAYGFGLLLSALTVFFRDISHFLGILLQLWFWTTPIIYSLALVEDRPWLHTALLANPMTGMIIGFRAVLLDGTPPELSALAYSAVVALVVFCVGVLVFRRTEHLFPELV